MVRFIHDDDAPVNPTLQPRVLALGLPRCATSSLQSALETLGHTPCLHMAKVQPSTARQRLVTAALHAKDDTALRQKLLAQLLAGFAATTDFPAILFAPDLMDMYPDAALVLNTRRGGAAAWHRSFSEGLAFFDSWAFWVATALVRSDRAMMGLMRATDAVLLERWGMTFREERMYEVHNAWVRQEAKKRGREVLEFVAEDGWEPLCSFLGVGMPLGVEYPWVNDQSSMKIVKRFIIARGLAYWACLVLAVLLVVKLSVLLPLGVIAF